MKSGSELDVLRDFALAQPSKRDAARHGLPGDGGQHLGQRLPGERIDVPIGADEEHPD